MEHEVLRACGLVYCDDAGQPRLDHVDILLTAGSGFGIVGTAGAGKHSLCQALCGEIVPQGGCILLDEMPTDVQTLQRVGLRIDRESRLLAGLSVAENLLLAQPFRRFWYPARRLRKLCGELLAPYGLKRYLDACPAELPPALQHRLLLVRAALQGKRFVALDGAADGCTLEECIALADTIARVRAHGLTVLYTAAYMDKVIYSLQRCAAMERGRVVKLFHPQDSARTALRPYLYGYCAPIHLSAVPDIDGAPLVTACARQFYAGSYVAILDRDGTAHDFVHALARACAKEKLPAPAVLGADAAAHSWVSGMDILDNLLLAVSTRIAGPFWHIPARMRRLVRQECAAHTGLRDAQLSGTPDRLTHGEQLSLLLYRTSLCGARVYVLEHPSADRADRAVFAQATQSLLADGCCVVHITSGAEELFDNPASLLYWEHGTLREDTV